MSARKKMGLPLQMGIGMVLGILVGTLAPKLGISAAFFKPFGDLFINLVRMVVVPLVLATLVSGAASVGDVGRLGRVAAKTLVFYFATTALAVAIGLVLGNIFQPGVGLDLSTANLSAKEVAAPSLVQVLMGIVPLNPVDALAKGNILQIIFFAVLVGMAISLCGDKAKPAAAFFDAMSEVMIRVTSMVMHYAPIGVFALMAYTVSNHGLEVLLPLIKLIGIMYLGCLIHVIITYLPCIRYAGLKPGTFFRGLSAPLLTSFTTCSSAAALSTNLTCVQKLGASRSVSSFSIPLGNTINMDGTAIYMGIVTIFAAEIYGMPLPLDQQISVLLIALLASVGTMGVPGAALIMLSMIFTHVGIPLSWTWPVPPSTCWATPPRPSSSPARRTTSIPSGAPPCRTNKSRHRTRTFREEAGPVPCGAPLPDIPFPATFFSGTGTDSGRRPPPRPPLSVPAVPSPARRGFFVPAAQAMGPAPQIFRPL